MATSALVEMRLTSTTPRYYPPKTAPSLLPRKNRHLSSTRTYFRLLHFPPLCYILILYINIINTLDTGHALSKSFTWRYFPASIFLFLCGHADTGPKYPDTLYPPNIHPHTPIVHRLVSTDLWVQTDWRTRGHRCKFSSNPIFSCCKLSPLLVYARRCLLHNGFAVPSNQR